MEEVRKFGNRSLERTNLDLIADHLKSKIQKMPNNFISIKKRICQIIKLGKYDPIFEIGNQQAQDG